MFLRQTYIIGVRIFKMLFKLYVSCLTNRLTIVKLAHVTFQMISNVFPAVQSKHEHYILISLFRFVYNLILIIMFALRGILTFYIAHLKIKVYGKWRSILILKGFLPWGNVQHLAI